MYDLFVLPLGAFTNDVIILGGGGLEKDDERWRGCWAKDDVTFFIMISGENFKEFGFKKFYYKFYY